MVSHLSSSADNGTLREPLGPYSQSYECIPHTYLNKVFPVLISVREVQQGSTHKFSGSVYGPVDATPNLNPLRPPRIMLSSPK